MLVPCSWVTHDYTYICLSNRSLQGFFLLETESFNAADLSQGHSCPYTWCRDCWTCAFIQTAPRKGNAKANMTFNVLLWHYSVMFLCITLLVSHPFGHYIFLAWLIPRIIVKVWCNVHNLGMLLSKVSYALSKGMSIFKVSLAVIG